MQWNGMAILPYLLLGVTPALLQIHGDEVKSNETRDVAVIKFMLPLDNAEKLGNCYFKQRSASRKVCRTLSNAYSHHHTTFPHSSCL